MSAPHNRTRWILLGLFITVVAVLAVFGPNYLAKEIRERSVRIAEEACGPRSHIVIGSVQLALLPGNVTWADVRIEQQVDSLDTTWTYDRSILISGHVDTIMVKGLSLWRLLAAKTLAVRSFTLVHPQLELIAGNMRSVPDDPEPGTKKGVVNTIRLDSLRLDSGTFRMRNVQPDKPGFTSKGLHVNATGVRLVLPHRKVPFALSFATAKVRLQGIDAALPPVYDARINEITIVHPSGDVSLKDILMIPRKGPQEYGKVVPFETDLFNMHIDSLGFHGMDLIALVNARSLLAQQLFVSHANVDVYRDKSLPDGPSAHKNMPARLIRNLPFRVCLDSVIVDSLTVRYHEKDVVTPEYGTVAFEDINATITGLCNTHPENNPLTHLIAHARLYSKAPLKLDFRTSVFDSTDHFTIHTLIGALPFTAFNQMTNDLIMVKTTAGTIGGIDYLLEADENRAHGRVDVEYQDLTISITKRDGTGEKNKLMSFLANQLTHSKNVRGDDFRHGDFAIERYKDRQIFNYLWRGLREGMMATMLPQVVSDVKDATSGTKADKEEKKRAKRRVRKAKKH